MSKSFTFGAKLKSALLKGKIYSKMAKSCACNLCTAAKVSKTEFVNGFKSVKS